MLLHPARLIESVIEVCRSRSRWSCCRCGLAWGLVLLLAGCGGGQEGAATPQNVPPPPPPVQQPAQAQRGAPPAEQKPAPKRDSERQSRDSRTDADSTATVRTSNDFQVENRFPAYAVVSPSEAEANRFFAVRARDDLPAGTVAAVPASRIDPDEAAAAISANLPSGFTPILEQGATEDGYPLRIRCERDGKEMAFVPGGVFLQGPGTGGPEPGDSPRPMFVSPFYIDVTEVTVGEFNGFRRRLRNDPQPFPLPAAPLNDGDGESLPAVGIIWRDANNYARYHGKELPTESEWEKAGRGPDGRIYPWGNGRPLWNRPRRLGEITAVKSFPSDRSLYGVFDLSGNAREWVNDWYVSEPFREAATRDGSPPRDWTGPKQAAPSLHRVIKGGTDGWELWHRGHANMRDQLDDVGFRCVLRIR
jgi:formylglycine-generating enzyme